MNPEEFRSVRARLGLTQSKMAAMLRLEGPRTVRRWEQAESEIPGSVELVLQIIMLFPEVREWLNIETTT